MSAGPVEAGWLGHKKKRSRGDASRPLSFCKTGRLSRIVEDRGAGGERGADGDDPLIGAAAEAEPQVLKSRDEASVHEDVAELEESTPLRVRHDLLVGVAGVDPDRLALRQSPTYLLHYRHQPGALHRFAPEERQPGDVGVAEVADHPCGRLLAPLGPEVGVLVEDVEAVDAVQRAAGDEDGGADPLAIGHIVPADLCVVEAHLYMEYAGLDLLCPPFVPEVLSEVAAGPADDGELGAILIVALRALPLVVVIYLDLAVEAADVAVVTLGIELPVRDVVVDVADHRQHGGDVIGHIGNLDVGDHAAGGEVLKLALEVKLLEDTDRLPHVDVVAIGVVALVGDVLYRAETGEVDLGKAIGEALGGRAVESKAEPGLRLPLIHRLP